MLSMKVVAAKARDAELPSTNPSAAAEALPTGDRAAADARCRSMMATPPSWHSDPDGKSMGFRQFYSKRHRSRVDPSEVRPDPCDHEMERVGPGA